MECEKFKADLKNKALEQRDTTAAHIVAASLAGRSEGQMELLPSNKHLLESVQQKRLRHDRQALGAEPCNFASLDALQNPQSLQMLDGQFFLLHDSSADSGDDRFLIFGAQENVEVLADCQTWKADGIFKICPELFEQVYTVNGSASRWTFPYLYGLLPGKSAQVYLRFWRKVFELCQGSIPEILLADFEKAAFLVLTVQKLQTDIDIGCFSISARQSIGMSKRKGSHRSTRLTLTSALELQSLLP